MRRKVYDWTRLAQNNRAPTFILKLWTESVASHTAQKNKTEPAKMAAQRRPAMPGPYARSHHGKNAITQASCAGGEPSQDGLPKPKPV